MTAHHQPVLFNTGPVYFANRQSTADIVINQGGTDSGKTYSILQLLIEIATTTKAPSSDPIITILSESVPNSKKGAYRTFQAIISTSDFAYSKIQNWNATDRTITFKTGWIMEFIGATDEQNAKQGKRQYLFCNEANGIPWPIFWQMAKRTRIRTFIDYNPSAPFWAHEKLIGTTPKTNDLSAVVQLIISDHRHNPFLSKADHDKTENIKDPELWRVYARGMTGNLSGIIYPNWKQIPDKDFPWDEPKFGGLDFGYTNDPTAGSRMCRIADNIYVHELCYTPGLTARQIGALFKGQGFTDQEPIYCEHDGAMIRELRMNQQLLAIPARKGPNSLVPGISKVKEYNIFYTESSKNIHFERMKYMWTKDPLTGKFINVPTEVDNHHMDEIRYGVSTHFYRAVN
jgi:phage terminase large subunit